MRGAANRLTISSTQADRPRISNDNTVPPDGHGGSRGDVPPDGSENTLHEANQRTRQEVFAIAKNALADLATTTIEERMSDVFIRRLSAIDGEARMKLGLTLEAHSAVVCGPFELPSEQRAMIQRAFNQVFSRDVLVQFETDPELIRGLALIVNGQQVTWSVGDYLASLQESVGDQP